MSIPGISERFESPDEQLRAAIEGKLINLRVAIPGEIVDFNPKTQTATVQPTITENIRVGTGELEAANLPVLSDVPVQFPGGGGFALTFPVLPGDECLLVFADMCIDGWWQSGGVQNQMEKRRHDLSDAMCLMGFSSVPKAVEDPSLDAIAIRNEDNSTHIELKNNGIFLKGNIFINGSLDVNGTDFDNHVHGGVERGSGSTNRPE